MSYETSPGVERAAEFARELARQRGAAAVSLTDWLLGLIAEDEGRPATLLTRIGVELPSLRDALASQAGWVHPVAPAAQSLFNLGREKAIALRADPTLTTEFVFLAVLEADDTYRDQLAALGVRLAALESLLSTVQRTDPVDDEPGPEFVVPEPAEQSDAGRIVDASLNRGREALRVLEDYCRFVLNDRTLTEELKHLRHDLAESASRLPSRLLLSARDTPGDVGTSVSTAREFERTSPAQVAGVNLKRLQEALRSTEEYGKVLDASFSRRVEALRYRAYTLERAIVRGETSRTRLADARLYVLLSGSQCVAALDWTIAEAAAGGAQIIQLREKSLTDQELLERARNVRRWTRAAGLLLIVNDRPDIARLVEADGVHLGQDDLPVAAARRIVGPEALIGVSTHNTEQVRRAILDGADYLGVGPTFPSQTKSFEEFPGLEFVRTVAQETSLPAFALGGITRANISQITAAGLRRVAVSAEIARAEDPAAVARLLRSTLDG